MNKKLNEKTAYYGGIDVGTNSAAIAVTDTNYNLLKYKGEPMWSVQLFEDGGHSQDRRDHRIERRRLDRRQYRIKCLQEIFAKIIGNLDETFFIRILESNLYQEDKSDTTNANVYFNDNNYKDEDY